MNKIKKITVLSLFVLFAMSLVFCLFGCVKPANGDIDTSPKSGITLTVPENIKVISGEKYYLLNNVTASDTDDGVITHKIKIYVDDVENQNGYVVFEENGTHTIKFKVVNSKNQEKTASVALTVVSTFSDITKPVFLGVKSFKVVPNTNVDLLDGVTAIDDVDGDLTNGIQIVSKNNITITNGTVKIADEGEYDFELSSADNSGNVGYSNVKVIVDKEANDRARAEYTYGGASTHKVAGVATDNTNSAYLYPTEGNTTSLQVYGTSRSSFVVVNLGIQEKDFTNNNTTGVSMYVNFGGNAVTQILLTLGRGSEKCSTVKYVDAVATETSGWYKIDLKFKDFTYYYDGTVDSLMIATKTDYTTVESEKYSIYVDELCVYNSQGQVGTPNPTVSGKVVSWKAITGATAYKVFVDGQLKITSSSLTYSLEEITTTGKHSITVQALGDGETYLDGNVSSACYYSYIADGENYTLDAPIISISSKKIVWSKVEFANAYEVYSDSILKATVTEESYAFNYSDANAHTIQIKAINTENSNVLASDLSNSIYIKNNQNVEDADLSNNFVNEYNGAIVSNATDVSEFSNKSMYLSTSKIDASNVYAGFKYTTGVDLTYAILSFDVKLVSNVNNNRVSIKIYNVTSDLLIEPLKVSQASGVTVTSLSNGWYRVVVNCEEAFGIDLSTATHIRLGFSNSDLTAFATIGLDNFNIDLPARLPSTTVTLNDKTLTWNAVEGVENYTVVIGKKTFNTTNTSYVIDNSLLDTGVFNTYILANAVGFTSSKSNVVTYTYIKEGETLYAGVNETEDLSTSLSSSAGTASNDTTKLCGSLSTASKKIATATGATTQYGTVRVKFADSGMTTLQNKVIEFDFFADSNLLANYLKVSIDSSSAYSVYCYGNNLSNGVTVTEYGNGWVHVKIVCNTAFTETGLASANRVSFAIKNDTTTEVGIAYIDNFIVVDAE